MDQFHWLNFSLLILFHPKIKDTIFLYNNILMGTKKILISKSHHNQMNIYIPSKNINAVNILSIQKTAAATTLQNWDFCCCCSPAFLNLRRRNNERSIDLIRRHILIGFLLFSFLYYSFDLHGLDVIVDMCVYYCMYTSSRMKTVTITFKLWKYKKFLM